MKLLEIHEGLSINPLDIMRVEKRLIKMDANRQKIFKVLIYVREPELHEIESPLSYPETLNQINHALNDRSVQIAEPIANTAKKKRPRKAFMQSGKTSSENQSQ